MLATLKAIYSTLLRPFVSRQTPGALQTTAFPLCSECFQDEGLKLDAAQLGVANVSPCRNCGKEIGRKLTIDSIVHLAHRFFVGGSFLRLEYGGVSSHCI